jgi:hypothetical protein
MDELHYEPHWRRSVALFGLTDQSNRETVAYALRQAQHAHALAVFNPLRDWFLKAITLSEKLTNENAKTYMKHGAGRRLSMTFHAYRHISMITDPTRTQPLTHDEQQDLSRDLNVLYMHTRGVLDNFAWSLLHERHPDIASGMNPYDVGLFSPKYRAKCSCFSEIDKDIDAHKDWNKDVKDRRDPVAHRIPLYIPPSLLNEQEGEAYKRLWERYGQEIAELKLDDAGNTMEQMDRIGRFVPHFLHDPSKAPIPIIPDCPGRHGAPNRDRGHCGAGASQRLILGFLSHSGGLVTLMRISSRPGPRYCSKSVPFSCGIRL